MKTVFMFGGQGSQYYHMGSKLMESDPVFRDEMRRLDLIYRAACGGSLVEELYHSKHHLSDAFSRLSLTHPAIFMVGYALARSLQAQGIEPDLVMGSSLGEFIAAAIAGVIDAETALTAVIEQSSMIQAACGKGRLIAVLDDMSVLDRHPDLRRLCQVGAYYTASQFVVSGELSAMSEVKKLLTSHDILHQELVVEYGFHSSAIAEAGGEYRSYLKGIGLARPVVPMVSCVTGGMIADDSAPGLPADYFWSIVEQPIRFGDAVRAVEAFVDAGEPIMYIDLGPSGSLANAVKYIVGGGHGGRGAAGGVAAGTADGSGRSKVFQIMSAFRQEVKKMEDVRSFYTHNNVVKNKPAKKERLLACVFPGQGSQKRTMGEGLFTKYASLTRRADEILGYSIEELCMTDPRREQNQTQFTQPALYVVNALSFLASGLEPDYVAGHSLGEYDALFAAGAIDFETGLRLVQKRGALMAQMKEGGMAAVKGLSEEEIAEVIRRNRLDAIDVANYNTPNQIVLSGPRDLINKSGAAFEQAGATLYFPLNVSGAFHSRYMQPARDEFRKFLGQFNFKPLQIPVISNVTAAPYTAPAMADLLADQLIKPVRWTSSVEYILSQGVEDLQEVGPGDVLTKLIYGIRKSAAVPA